MSDGLFCNKFFYTNLLTTYFVYEEITMHGNEKSASREARCILRLPEVQRRTGYKRAQIYRLMSQNQFPQNIRIGLRAVGWDSEAINQWVQERLESCR